MRRFSPLPCATLLAICGLFGSVLARAAQAPQMGTDDRIVLITLDGARPEEMFGGLDVTILRSTLKNEKVEEHPTYRRFWAATAEKRREKLLPFFWGTLMREHGSIAGERARGSAVRLTNRHWFSYPGYAEILLGEAHDRVIASNDPVRNPFPTVLEVLREQLRLPSSGVATFASWGVFNEIAEHTAGSTTVDAGPDEPLPADEETRTLLALQRETLPPWGNVRQDIYTFQLAMRHLRIARPRVLYVAFDETDDWAHDGRYDRTLDAYARTDRYLRDLWTWIESQPDYRGRTHLLLTTDHGRGKGPGGWRDHGAKVGNAEWVWIAFISPHMTQRGSWSQHAPLTTSQIAATLAGWAGVDWASLRPAAGQAISGTQRTR